MCFLQFACFSSVVFFSEKLNCLITSTFLTKRLQEKHSTFASNWLSSKSYLCFIFYM